MFYDEDDYEVHNKDVALGHNEEGDEYTFEDGYKGHNEDDDIRRNEDDVARHNEDDNTCLVEDNVLRSKESLPKPERIETSNGSLCDSNEKQRSRLHRYEETVILFRPMIVSDVIVNQVLPHLQTCLSKPDISAIKGEHDQHKATELLLEKITSCKDPGTWKTFVNALKDSGYKKIVDALKRRSIADDNDPKKILHIFTPQLRERIIPSEIMEELLRTDVINNDDKHEILQRERSSGSIAAADLLLDRLPRKHPDWFGNCLLALRNIGHSDLVEMLTGEPATYEFHKSADDLINAAEETIKKEPFPVRNNDCAALAKEQEAGAREDLQKKRKIKYTPVVIDGKLCVGKDDHEKENVESGMKALFSKSDLSSLSPNQCYGKEQSSPSLREKKENLLAETKENEADVKEYEEILKAHEKNNELLKKIRNFCEKIKLKEKEADALKAANSGGDEAAEDNDTYDSSAYFEDIVQYIAPGKRLTTLDFRESGFGTAVIRPTCVITGDVTKPVQLYDVGRNYNDSAFYSYYDSMYTTSHIYNK